MKKIYLITILFLTVLPSQVQANPLKSAYGNAMIAYNKGDYNTAIKLFEKTLEIYPNIAAPYTYIGFSHKQLGAKPQSIRGFFEKSIEIDPNYGLAYDGLGKTYYALGDFQKAEYYTKKALELEPGLTSSKLSLAWIYLLGLNQPRDAVRCFEEIVVQHPIPYAHFGLGMAYFMDDQKPKVLEMITKLRNSGNENLAKELERMVRDREYAPPREFRAATNSMTIPPKQQSTIVRDLPLEAIAAESSQKEMPVRMRSRKGRLTPSQPATAQAEPNYTGKERIEAMQRRYQRQGSDY